MRVAITGATGLIGSRLVAMLERRGDSVVALSRDPVRARELLGTDVVAWNPLAGPAPAQTLSEVDGVIHLAGEPVAQRWTEAAKERIRSSRVSGTEHLVAGLQDAQPRPGTLVSASAVGYYGDRGTVEVDETAPPGSDFLASVCVDWERAADRASELGTRVVRVRIGAVLDRTGGALQKLLPPFRAGLGGPVAGGKQYMPWIAIDDLAGIFLAALDGTSGAGAGGGAETGGEAVWAGPINGCGPAPATNAEFSRALGQALRRPAVVPVPRFALQAMFGEMASVLIASQRVVPARAVSLGYKFAYPDLPAALRAALA